MSKSDLALAVSIVVALAVLLFSCGKTDPLNGNAYKHETEDGRFTYIATFKDDSLKYELQDAEDSLSKDFTYKYKILDSPDDKVGIKLEQQPDWWDDKVWWVVITDYGLQSVRTGNKYYLIK